VGGGGAGGGVLGGVGGGGVVGGDLFLCSDRPKQSDDAREYKFVGLKNKTT